MAVPECAPLQDDEPILSARYTTGWFWFGCLAGAFFVYAAIHGLYTFPSKGQYVKTVCAVIGVIIFVPLTIDIMLTKEFLFYSDRVVKVWYLLGRRTIPYASAVVRGPAEAFRWIQKGYTIREFRDDWTRRFFQIPILYNARFVDREVAEQIDAIMAYMAEGPLNKPTRFTEVTLPKEVVSEVIGRQRSRTDPLYPKPEERSWPEHRSNSGP